MLLFAQFTWKDIKAHTTQYSGILDGIRWANLPIHEIHSAQSSLLILTMVFVASFTPENKNCKGSSGKNEKFYNFNTCKEQ